MVELFIFGSFWFWALVAAEIVLLFVFNELENGFGATISLGVFAAALQFMGGIDLIGYVVKHPIHILAALIAYFLLGTVWGVFKWRLFVLDRVEVFKEAFQRFLSSVGLPNDTKINGLPIDVLNKWNKFDFKYDTRLGKRIHGEEISKVPSAKEHKGEILRWMSFWPFGVVWYVINDFVKGIFKAIYQRIAAFLQGIADKIWQDAGI